MHAEPESRNTARTRRAGTGSRLGRRRDESRDPEIINAALEVLTETGYDRMTMDAVATRAKAGKATMYRRWPSKAELVVEAVTRAGRTAAGPESIPDTGSLRGDLLALVDTESKKDDARKLQIMVGLISALPQHPDLAAIVQEQLVAPRTALVRTVLDRAAARGEISPERNFDMMALVGPAITTYRLMIMNEAISHDFLISMIDDVLLPMATGTKGHA